MKRCVHLFMLVLIALSIAITSPSRQSHAQEEINLSISCTCSPTQVEWMTTFVIPNFQAAMQEQGKTVTVEVIDYDLNDEEYREQIALDFSLGEGSDVAGFDGFWVAEFVESNLLKPLNQVGGAEVDDWDGWAHIPDDVEAVLTYQGERYGIPNGSNARAIFYRTDLFEQAGIEVPWQPTSWEDILETSRQLQAAGIEIPLQLDAGTIMGEATTLQGYFMVLLGTGSHVYDFEQNKWIIDHQKIAQALDFYATVYQEGLGDAELQLTEDARNLSIEAFRDGRVGIYIESDFLWRVMGSGEQFELTNRNEVVEWAKMPAAEPGAGFREQDFVTISGGSGWVLSPNTPYRVEAWALLSYLSGQEATQTFVDMQPRISFRDDVEITGDPLLTEIAEELLPITTLRPLHPAYPQISNEVQLMTERVITGEMTSQEAVEAYAEAVKAIVGEENVVEYP